MSELIKELEQENKAIRDNYPSFGPGDTINVHYKIKEGNKERIQQFQGTVLQIKNVSSNGETFTVRKISSGIAVERIFPILSPNIDKIELLRRGKVRRAKLYYLRDRKGKSARIAEKIKKKIGVDVSVKPEEPKTNPIASQTEEVKVVEEKKETPKVETKSEKPASEKK